MSEFPSHDIFLQNAREKEAVYEWTAAAEIYESAIPAFVEKGENLEAGETQERAAYCRYRAAYQSETRDEFKLLLEVTSEAYRKATDIYEVLDDPRRDARILTNRVMEKFYRSWLIEAPTERKTQVERCVQEFKEALDASEKVEDIIRYGKVTNDFLQILFSLSEIAFTHTEGKKIIEEALNYGSKALKALKNGDRGYVLARCYYLLSLFLPDRIMDVIDSPEKQKEYLDLGTGYIKTAVEFSNTVGDPYITALSYGIYSYYLSDVIGDLDNALSFAQKGLDIGIQIGDRLVLARSHEFLSYLKDGISGIEEDRDKKRIIANEATQHAAESISNYKIILNPILTAFLAHSEGQHTISYIETERHMKQKYIKKGIETALTNLEYARESGSLLGQMYIYIILGYMYQDLANVEHDEYDKRNLFVESMSYREQYVDSAMQAQPFRYWNIAVNKAACARINGQLADYENDPEKREKLIAASIADMDRSNELFNLHFKIHNLENERRGYAIIQEHFGTMMSELFFNLNEKKYLNRSIQYFETVIEEYKKFNWPSYTAEILWKLGWIYYRIKEYKKSGTEFDGASRYYYQACNTYPNHRKFYADYSSYMEAWGNIVRAMDYHSRDEYFLEKEYFEKAVDTLTSSDRWRYLGSNYQAWAKLAEAESESRNDQCEKAITLFTAASELFSNAQNSIEARFDSIGVIDEANMASELIIASDLRVDYCHGRIVLEEAKLLDRKGERIASSRRYGEAAQIFHEIVEALQTEQERQEMRPLHSLCLAWQRKTQAEAEASSDLYMEASDLFEEARKYSTNEKTRLLTQGHANFCRALSAGIHYEVSREERYHQELVRHIGSATDFYVRAGYDSALEYSRATQRLFEAYQYLDRARGSSDPGEGARYYGAAERLLRVSAEAFQRARHPDKMDEVVRLLRNLKEDRQIAISLSEILDTPGISSSTESFRMPTPSHEYPVGLEGFEHADIQVKMFLPEETLTSGEEFSLELEFYNPGRSSASLVRVERLVPDDFEVSGVSGMYRFTDEGLDLRGKRIGPLSTVEVSLRARPHSRGEFRLEPRVMFVDDSGEQRFSVLEPGVLNVREMGILSWLRGTRPSF